MPFSFSLFQTRKVKCPNGDIHIIYNDIEKLFPYAVSNASQALSGKLSIPKSIDTEFASQISSAIDSLIVSIDKSNGSLVIEQRAAYSAYSANPCGGSEWYKRQLENLSYRRQRVLIGRQVFASHTLDCGRCSSLLPKAIGTGF